MIARRKFLKSVPSIFAAFSFSSLSGISRINGDQKSWPIQLIIDADTANEVDDLFAIARALIEPRLDLIGITAAQWHTSPKAPNDSVGLSQQLNQEILELMGKTKVPLVMGSNLPLVSTVRPQPSRAASFIIEKALAMPEKTKLHIAVLGPCTNIASAVLIEPKIIPKISVHYIGFWHHPVTNTWNKREFNTDNDPNAVNVLLNTIGLDFNVMTASTSQHLVFHKTVVDKHLKGKGGIGDYLVNRWENFDRFWQKDDPEKTKWIMWDVAIIEALAYPNLATKEVVETPHDNRLRDIHAYTEIDVEEMKKNYWNAFDQFFKK